RTARSSPSLDNGRSEVQVCSELAAQWSAIGERGGAEVRFRRRKLLVALPVVVGAIMAATPAAPAADPPSENASCVAQFVHGDPGPPGLFQSQNHEPM